MRQLQIGLFLFLTVSFTSCTNNDETEDTTEDTQKVEVSSNSQKDQVAGEWTLSSFSSDGEAIELTDCDQKTIWNFTTEETDPLGDGTETQKLNAVAPDDCEFYSFDAKWTVHDGQLFVSTSRIGGLGGNSLAGLMKIKELSDNLMVVEIMKKELIFKR